MLFNHRHLATALFLAFAVVFIFEPSGKSAIQWVLLSLILLVGISATRSETMRAHARAHARAAMRAQIAWDRGPSLSLRLRSFFRQCYCLLAFSCLAALIGVMRGHSIPLSLFFLFIAACALFGWHTAARSGVIYGNHGPLNRERHPVRYYFHMAIIFLMYIFSSLAFLLEDI